MLHDFAYSSASYRVRIALNLKGLTYDSRFYVLREGQQRSPEYLAINPAGLVPTLEDNGVRISQSLAIIEYLDQQYPDPRLIPAGGLDRIRAMELALVIACDIHPLNNLRVLKQLEERTGMSQDGLDDWYRHWVATGFTTLEATLPDTPFAGGDRPNIADVCLVPQLFNARRYKLDLTPYPRLVAIGDRAAALPAFQAAAPPPR